MSNQGDQVLLASSWLETVRKNDQDLLGLCRLDTFRGSGRGGQKRNKTSNAVRLTISDLAVTESTFRSRAQNITNALRKLRVVIALSLSPTIQRNCIGKALPREVQSYFNQGVIRINPQNPVFPLFIGCLVDLFIKHEGGWSSVAHACGVSNSQLRRFVEKHPALRMTLDKIQLEVLKKPNEGESGE